MFNDWRLVMLSQPSMSADVAAVATMSQLPAATASSIVIFHYRRRQ